MTWFDKHKVPLLNTAPQVRILSISEVSNLLGTDNDLSIKLIRDGCKMCNVPFVGGGTVFTKLNPDTFIELSNLKNTLSGALTVDRNYIMLYSKEDKKHPEYAYYKIIIIGSGDFNDLKKVLKIHKLKVFL